MARLEEVIAEIERLTLQTTETAPRNCSWNWGGFKSSLRCGGSAAWPSEPSARSWPFLCSATASTTCLHSVRAAGAFLYSCFIGLALFFVVAVIGRRAMEAQVQQWLQRAERVIQARNGAKA